jgi:hypothetical protein
VSKRESLRKPSLLPGTRRKRARISLPMREPLKRGRKDPVL